MASKNDFEVAYARFKGISLVVCKRKCPLKIYIVAHTCF